MERFKSKIDEYNRFRKEKLIPTVDALIAEAMELGYKFEVSHTRDKGHELTFYISPKSILYEYLLDPGKKPVSRGNFVEEVTTNERTIEKLYEALLNAQEGKPKLTGKYIPEDLK